MSTDLVPRPNSLANDSLRSAVEATEKFIAASKSKATRRAYSADWRDFQAWGVEHGLDTLPARPETVAAYLSAMATAEPPAKLSTIERRVSAIGNFHASAGIENPCLHAGVKATVAGIGRTIGSAPAKKAAITADVLAKVLRRIPDDELTGLRDRALLLIGFAGALRRSELVYLNVNDVERHPKGIVLTIRRSKTDQAGRGKIKAIPHGRKLMPVAALDAWLGTARITEGPIFRAVRGASVSSERLCDRQVSRIVKRRAAAAGLDPAALGGHSLRSGFISTAAEHGATLQSIADHAAHEKLDTTRSYIQVADAFRSHPGAKFI